MPANFIAVACFNDPWCPIHRKICGLVMSHRRSPSVTELQMANDRVAARQAQDRPPGLAGGRYREHDSRRVVWVVVDQLVRRFERGGRPKRFT